MFLPIEKKRLSETIVEQLRSRILSREWKAGDFLPPERELSKALGVTRVSLREALRTLEQESLIEIKHGEGSQVIEFTENAGLDILKHLMKLEAPDSDILRSALEFRALIGTELTRLAAVRASEEHIRELELIVATETGMLNDRPAIQRSDFHFFERMADASGNILIKFLMNSIREPYLAQADLFAELVGDPAETLRYHQEIIAAVRMRNPAEAARLAGAYMTCGMERIFNPERP